MVIKAASPVTDDNGALIGVLYGGKLLNRSYAIVDKVANTVFRGEVYKGKNIGTATIFQGDLRISTNVISKDGKRAVGTRVSKEVATQVLEKGKPWIDRAFVVNNWYITAYEPIKNMRGRVIGILYVGILEQKYDDIKKHTLLIFLLITLAGIVASFILAYILSLNITGPLKKLVTASGQLAEGKLYSRVHCDYNDELGDLGRSFNAMASSIEEREEKLKEHATQEVMRSEKLATLGQLAASVAHEINNPLAIIMGRAEFLASEIENESEKAASTVQRFLTFARQSEPELKYVNINKLLENSIGLAGHLAIMEKVTLEKELGEDVPVILIDPRLIEQVFINLILNAIQSMRAGGKLTVCSERKGGSVEIRFSDTGSGISKENIAKIFDPFFTTKKAGTGLGLAICRQIIEKHNGAIRIESEVGNGTTVYVTLPQKEVKEDG
jgi:two-component system NtrC family sensor kinase